MQKRAQLANLYELLSSMRLAICLLCAVAIASAIGSFTPQNQPFLRYVETFGLFWAQLFQSIGFFNVYGSVWFLCILGFLVLSTSLCIIRNTPSMLKEMRGYKQKATLQSLQAFKWHAAYPLPTNESLTPLLEDYLKQQGFRFRIKKTEDGDALIAAKKGHWQKLGYFFAHIAIILICVGGLLDGNIPLQLQTALGHKQAETRNQIPESSVPAVSRLASSNWSFRGNLNLSEGQAGKVVFLDTPTGYFVQELPFHIRLDRFYIEHYASGQPKLFASDITLIDRKTNAIEKATVKVNHPVTRDGITIYQANFDDGGSPITVDIWDQHGRLLQKGAQAISLQPQSITINAQPYQLEWGNFRAFNIEDFSQNTPSNTHNTWTKTTQLTVPKHLKNVGPSIHYKLRDNAGQATEYQSYMLPITLDGAAYFVTGYRTKSEEPMNFLRIPVDPKGELNGYMQLKQRLLNPAEHATITKLALEGTPNAEASQLREVIPITLALYQRGGFDGVEAFLQERVPQDKRDNVRSIYLKLLSTAALAAWRQDHPQPNATDERFVLDALLAISSEIQAKTPTYIQLKDFKQIQASGFQLTKAPGQNLVYLGCLLLILGVFVMFYLREQRIWLYQKGNNLYFSMSSNRKDSELERQFSLHQTALNQLIHKGVQ